MPSEMQITLGDDSTVDELPVGDRTTEVARRLGMADEELQSAIDSFRRARRVGFFELFRLGSAVGDCTAEEVHVRHGVEALLSAERHVARAARTLGKAHDAEPARIQFGTSVTALDEHFRVLLSDMRVRPDPSNVVAALKRVRRAIPHGSVRRYVGN